MVINLHTVLANAPYLADLARVHAGWFAALPQDRPDAALAGELADIRALGLMAVEEDVLSIGLRRAKGRIALLAAIAETGGGWSTAEATAALSDLADAAL